MFAVRKGWPLISLLITLWLGPPLLNLASETPMRRQIIRVLHTRRWREIFRHCRAAPNKSIAATKTNDAIINYEL